MRLIDVQLKNFMKHEDLRVEFASGMNVIRGGNEAGKSSLISSIAYSLFGSGALPQSVDDAVTWGTTKGSMSSVVQFETDTGRYKCSRSPSGAELIVDEKVVVTGQKEVSNKVAQLLFLPSVDSAGKLLLANQNDLRGVLSLGGASAAAFIEELIDLTEIDAMLSDLSDRLPHSSDAKKQALALKEEAARTLADLPSPIPTAALQQKLEDSLAGKVVAGELAREARLSYEAADAASNQLQGALQTHVSSLKVTETKVGELKTTLVGLQDEVAKRGSLEDELQESNALLLRTQEYSFYNDVWLPFSSDKTTGVVDVFWEGSEESYKAYKTEVLKERQQHTEDATRIKTEIAHLQRGLILDTVCPACGQDIVDVVAVEAQNAKIAVDVAKNQSELASAEAALLLSDQTMAQISGMEWMHSLTTNWLAKNGQHDLVRVDTSQLPYKVVFTGLRPDKPERKVTQQDVDVIQQQLQETEQQLSKVDGWLLDIERLEADAEALKLERDRCLVESKVAKEKSVELNLQRKAADQTLQTITAKVNQQSSELERVVQQNETIADQGVKQKLSIKKWTAQVKEIQRNAGLIKAIREARGLISTQLWQSLLTTTQAYFSLFRGTPSTLGMSKKGIVVDGHLSKPSGSTLDILGLSLRLAMSKMFANNGICILDEPSSGCDDNRTAAMTGGLLGSDLDQIIMVTHKDIDEGSGRLIELS